MSEWSAGLTLLLCAACRAFGNYDGTDTGNDSAYSNIALELHTDGAYMRDPPALQLWTCMYTASDGGGVSRYVDGLRVAERLQQTDPAAYDFFRRTPLTYHCQDEGTSLVASGPVFEHGADPDSAQMERMRYNDYDRLTLSHLPAEDVARFYEHRRLLASILTDPSMELHHPLQPGTMAIVHNHRVLHGRTAFQGMRGLCGCYIGDDEFQSKLRRMASMGASTQQQLQQAAQTTDGGEDSADDPWNLLLVEGLDVSRVPPARLRY